MNQNQNKTIETIKETFERTDFPNLVWTSNHYNNFYAWLKLKNPADLPKAAELLQSLDARLCTVTAYSEDRSLEANRRAIAHHTNLR